jgi:hypothetical protein
MRTTTTLTLLIAISSFSSIGNAAAPMKGYALFSWFDMECSTRPSLQSAPNGDSWCYALVPGTNRQATAAELRKARVGIGELDKQLASLPRGSEVTWNNAVAADPSIKLALPDERAQTRVKSAAVRAGLVLTIAPTTSSATSPSSDRLRGVAERFAAALVAGDAAALSAELVTADEAAALSTKARPRPEHDAEQQAWVRARVAEADKARRDGRAAKLDRVELVDVTFSSAGGKHKRDAVVAVVTPIVDGRPTLPLTFVLANGRWRAAVP